MIEQIQAYRTSDGKTFFDRLEAEQHGFCLECDSLVREFLVDSGLKGESEISLALRRLLPKWEIWKTNNEVELVPPSAFEDAPEAPAAPVAPVAAPPALKLARKPEPPPAKIELPKFKRRVGIIGLLGAHVALVEKEFGKEFDLTFVEPHTIGRVADVKAVHKYLVMKAPGAAGKVNLVRKAGHEPIVVDGGLTRLRETLTELYCAA